MLRFISEQKRQKFPCSWSLHPREEGQTMNEWVSEWMRDWMNEGGREWMSEWMWHKQGPMACGDSIHEEAEVSWVSQKGSETLISCHRLRKGTVWVSRDVRAALSFDVTSCLAPQDSQLGGPGAWPVSRAQGPLEKAADLPSSPRPSLLSPIKAAYTGVSGTKRGRAPDKIRSPSF